jgi:hypothetical protein
LSKTIQNLVDYYSHNAAPRRILAVLLFVFSFSLVVWANYHTIASHSDGMASQDFMSLWEGGKTIVLSVNPYDAAVWRPLRVSYGSRFVPDATAPFPMWTFLFFVPFSYLTTQAAGALWVSISELSLLVGILVLARTLGWRGYAPLVLLLGIILYRPVYPALTNGQLVPVLLLFLVAAYILFQKGYPFVAGFLLALQIVKPNLALSLVLTLGWIFLLRRDWRALAGMATGGLVLLVVSWVILPGWLFDYLQVTGKTQVTQAMPTIWGLARVLGGKELWPASAILAGTLLYLALLLLIWRLRKDDWLLSLNLAVIAATFLTPYAWAYEQVILLFPNTVALRWGLASNWEPRWVWWAGWWLTGPAMSWVFFMYALHRGLDVVSGLMPLFSLVYAVVAWLAFKKAADSGAPQGNRLTQCSNNSLHSVDAPNDTSNIVPDSSSCQSLFSASVTRRDSPSFDRKTRLMCRASTGTSLGRISRATSRMGCPSGQSWGE